MSARALSLTPPIFSINARSGYLLPPNELLGRAIFTREAVSGATLALELDRAFRLITEELRARKVRGEPGGEGRARRGTCRASEHQ